jgi:hypothetical protein
VRRPTRDDDLRARLSRLDPAGGLPVDPVSGPLAADRLERAMSTRLQVPEPSTGGADRAPGGSDRPPGRRRVLVGAGAAVAAAATVTAGVLLTGGTPGAPGDGAPGTLTLAVPESDAMAACAMFSVEELARLPVAFAGTVVEEGDAHVVVDVDRWFVGGDAERVRLEGAIGAEAAALGYGVDFTEGGRFLVTASGGTVNGCGYSGPATAEYEQAFEQAFGG